MKDLQEGFKTLKEDLYKLAEDFKNELASVLFLFRDKIEQFFEKLYEVFLDILEKIGQSLENLSAQLSFKKKIKPGKEKD